MKGVSPLKPKYIVFSDKERATATHVWHRGSHYTYVCLVFFLKVFLLAYIGYTGGIHCDVSEYAYIVHWLGSPLPSLSLIPLSHT
jgi:hypothetical protein